MVVSVAGYRPFFSQRKSSVDDTWYGKNGPLNILMVKINNSHSGSDNEISVENYARVFIKVIYRKIEIKPGVQLA